MFMHKSLRGRQSKIDTFVCDSKAPEAYRCGFCGFKTNLKVNFAEHFRVFHEERGSNDMLERILECYSCDNCDFQTYSLLVFIKHIKIECRITSRNDREEQVDNDQWYEYEWGGSRWYRCKLCFHETICRQVIKCHVTRHHTEEREDFVQNVPDKVGRYICGDCKFQTSSLSEITTHYHNCNFKKSTVITENDDKWYRSTLEGVTWFICKLCSYQTNRRCIMRRHVSTHGKLRSKLKAVNFHKCDQCTNQFRRKSNLHSHVLRKHSTLKDRYWYECEQCSYKCRWSHSLKEHVSVAHAKPEDLNWFKCEHCTFKCNLNRYLQAHIKRKHAIKKQPKKLQCELCPSFTFKRKSSLERHMYTIHSDLQEIRWFQCEYCPFKSKHKGHLKKHVALKHNKNDEPNTNKITTTF